MVERSEKRQNEVRETIKALVALEQAVAARGFNATLRVDWVSCSLLVSMGDVVDKTVAAMFSRWTAFSRRS